MLNKISKPLTSGILATIALTILTYMAPLMGFPKMDIPGMLSMIMGVPSVIGWIAHFMIGSVFALAYYFVFSKILGKVRSSVIRGSIYGTGVFVFAQIAMSMMGLIVSVPPPQGNLALSLLGSLLGHLLYGITLVALLRERSTAKVSTAGKTAIN